MQNNVRIHSGKSMPRLLVLSLCDTSCCTLSCFSCDELVDFDSMLMVLLVRIWRELWSLLSSVTKLTSAASGCRALVLGDLEGQAGGAEARAQRVCPM